jgi:cytochrome c-type biogenesis protein CcmH
MSTALLSGGASGRVRPAVILAALTVSMLTASAAHGMGAAGAGSGAGHPKTTLPVIERQVMCVTCKIPLNVAQSPQADRERAFIQRLIDEGRDETQIKRALVGQFGATVLGLPAAHGFDLTVYLVPLAAVLLLLATFLTLLPRWRRSTREHAATEPDGPSLGAADAARLDSDLARFD